MRLCTSQITYLQQSKPTKILPIILPHSPHRMTSWGYVYEVVYLTDPLFTIQQNDRNQPWSYLTHLITWHLEDVVHEVVSLADELHVSVFDAIVYHLHKVTCTLVTHLWTEKERREKTSIMTEIFSIAYMHAKWTPYSMPLPNARHKKNFCKFGFNSCYRRYSNLS